MKTEWVTFDCYGTLIDWEGGIRAFFREHAGVPNPNALLDQWEQIQFQMVNGPYRKYRDILADSLRETLAAAGLPARPDANLAEALTRWTPFPDTNPALEELKRRGFKLGIISNTDDDLLARTLKHFTVPFDMVTTAEQSGAYKPNAPSFLLAAERIGPATITHVAFGERYDLDTARACGMQVVFVNRNGRPIPFQSDAEIPSLRELPGLFE